MGQLQFSSKRVCRKTWALGSDLVLNSGSTADWWGQLGQARGQFFLCFTMGKWAIVKHISGAVEAPGTALGTTRYPERCCYNTPRPRALARKES